MEKEQFLSWCKIATMQRQYSLLKGKGREKKKGLISNRITEYDNKQTFPLTSTHVL